MVNQMLFEHEAPPFDDIQQRSLKALGINSEPAIEKVTWFDMFCFLVDLLVGVNLNNKVCKISGISISSNKKLFQQ